MAATWLCTRWETPVSDVEVLMMNLHCRDGDLRITADPSTSVTPYQCIQFTFKKCPAFRSVLERFRTHFWNKFSATERPGRTFTVENSPWIAELAKMEPT